MNDFTPAGSWFLEADGSRLEMTIFESHNKYSGVITHEDGFSELISNVSWDPESFSLDFWWDSLGQWCRASVAEEAYYSALLAPSRSARAPSTPAQEPSSAPASTPPPGPAQAAAPQAIQDAPLKAPPDIALYELAAALAPVFTSLPRDPGATGAAFGNLLFKPSIVGPCCPLDGDWRSRAMGDESASGESASASYADRRCA